MAKSFTDLLNLAQKKGPKKISVAVAEDIDVLGAVKEATEKGIAEPILVGDEKKIREIAKELNFDLLNIEIINEKDGEKACRKAVSLVSSGQAEVLMKGLIDTAVIMKQVLDKEIGLRTGKLISHVVVFSVPTYHKVLFVTDAAMNIAPSLDQKKEIIDNAVELAHSLDIEEPKVAVIGAKEKVSNKMEATVHAKELENMNKRGEILGCVVEGPFALDNAISKEAAIHKGVESDMAGDVDILLVPNIEAGNVLYKSLTYFAKAKSAGIIAGTKAPIVLTSRTDTKEAKLYSIALGVLRASKI
ncbi:MAG TPA: phosphate butyryltransferase [Tissierellales bacterium]|nr:phosphate butyryltransferase [Tissierellales bacterium]